MDRITRGEGWLVLKLLQNNHPVTSPMHFSNCCCECESQHKIHFHIGSVWTKTQIQIIHGTRVNKPSKCHAPSWRFGIVFTLQESIKSSNRLISFRFVPDSLTALWLTTGFLWTGRAFSTWSTTVWKTTACGACSTLRTGRRGDWRTPSLTTIADTSTKCTQPSMSGQPPGRSCSDTNR